MTVYSNKNCELCKEEYTPTSPKQKFCSNCQKEARKQRNVVYDKKRNRQRHDVLYQRKCLACGYEFQTYYPFKKYCGAADCEIIRVRIKNRSIHLRRDMQAKRDQQKQWRISNRDEYLRRAADKYRRKHPNATPYVGGRVYKHSYEYIRQYFEDRNYILLSKEYKNNKTMLITKCPKGHIWHTNYHSFEDKATGITGNRCLHCYAEGSFTSRLELRVRDYLKANRPNIKVIYNDRSQIKPYELDIYFPEHNLAVELCGLFWHSEFQGGKSKDYHYRKMMMCYEKEIRLITVFEDEIIQHFDIVMSRILQALGQFNDRVFARKCQVVELSSSDANAFFEDNHIQGKTISVVCYGLVYNDVLVAAASFGKPTRKHTSNSDSIELKRFCTKAGCSVIGGVSRLFTYLKEYAIQNGYLEIKSYCDMRYANSFSPVYEKLGFTLTDYTEYTPHYFKDFKRYRNISLRKTPEERLTGKTEWELRKEQGYDRIWDCGHRTYVYVL